MTLHANIVILRAYSFNSVEKHLSLNIQHNNAPNISYFCSFSPDEQQRTKASQGRSILMENRPLVSLEKYDIRMQCHLHNSFVSVGLKKNGNPNPNGSILN